MRFLLTLHPRHYVRALREIDKEATAEKARFKGPDYQPAVVLFTGILCLLFNAYLSRSWVFQRFMDYFSLVTVYEPKELHLKIAAATFSPILIYAWWALVLFIGYVLVPILVIKYVLRDSIRNYYIGISGFASPFKWYLILTVFLLIGSTLLSFKSDFSHYYPFYRMAQRSWADLLLWECLYLAQFVFLEFFFRGFILHGCKRAFGFNAIFVMCVPYAMIHITKPWIEAVWSVFFGLFIGMLVLRSRSIWGAVLVHWAVALNMDLMALLQTQRFPNRWWP
jgi:membrane protease YdiL (CAAX protease family)